MDGAGRRTSTFIGERQGHSKELGIGLRRMVLCHRLIVKSPRLAGGNIVARKHAGLGNEAFKHALSCKGSDGRRHALQDWRICLK